MTQTWEFMDGNRVKTCSWISGIPSRLVPFDNRKTTGDENYKRSHVCNFQHVVFQVLKSGVSEIRVASTREISKSAGRENINSE